MEIADRLALVLAARESQARHVEDERGDCAWCSDHWGQPVPYPCFPAAFASLVRKTYAPDEIPEPPGRRVRLPAH